MWPNPQETADLVIFTEEILNRKLLFFAVNWIEQLQWCILLSCWSLKKVLNIFYQIQKFTHNLWRWSMRKLLNFNVEWLHVARVIARALFVLPLRLSSHHFQFYYKYKTNLKWKKLLVLCWNTKSPNFYCSKRKKRQFIRINSLVENRLHGELFRPNVCHYGLKFNHQRERNIRCP